MDPNKWMDEWADGALMDDHGRVELSRRRPTTTTAYSVHVVHPPSSYLPGSSNTTYYTDCTGHAK